MTRLRDLDTRRKVYDAIDRERAHQQRTHPGTRSVPGWLLVIEAELAEARQAWVDSPTGDDAAALRELLQVVACGVACLEQNGIYEREVTP